MEDSATRSTVEEQRQRPVLSRVGESVAVGAVAGGVVGAIPAAWLDVPAVKGGRVLPALKSSMTVIGGHSALLAAVAGTYTLTEAGLDTVTGSQSPWNSAIAGCASGGIIGMRVQKASVGVGACAALAAMAAAMSQIEGSGSSHQDFLLKKVQQTTGDA